jgi:hypothetical protein
MADVWTVKEKLREKNVVFFCSCTDGICLTWCVIRTLRRPVLEPTTKLAIRSSVHAWNPQDVSYEASTRFSSLIKSLCHSDGNWMLITRAIKLQGLQIPVRCNMYSIINKYVTKIHPAIFPHPSRPATRSTLPPIPYLSCLFRSKGVGAWRW